MKHKYVVLAVCFGCVSCLGTVVSYADDSVAAGVQRLENLSHLMLMVKNDDSLNKIKEVVNIGDKFYAEDILVSRLDPDAKAKQKLLAAGKSVYKGEADGLLGGFMFIYLNQLRSLRLPENDAGYLSRHLTHDVNVMAKMAEEGTLAGVPSRFK